MSKFFRVALISIFVVLLAASFFVGGMWVGWSLPGEPQDLLAFLDLNVETTQVGELEPAAISSPVDREALMEPFWEAWDLVQSQFIDKPVDETQMLHGAIRGMMESLGDPHSSYMDPDQYRQQSTSIDGEYEGIGAWVDITGEFLTIISPMPGSPAEKAGLKSGDKVTGVDGEDMSGQDGNLVLKKILGPAGSEVKLTIQRESEKPFDVTILREKITVPSLETKILNDNIAYIHLYNYGDNTGDELHAALKEILTENPKGLIFDLRNNGGGLLTTAIEVVTEFLPEDKVAMYEDFSDGTRKVFKTKRGGLATDIPLVVLINEGTASASEITAGAIQDYGRGKLVGVTSFGKGSVQNWIPLQDDQGAVRITIARWLTPNEKQIAQVGLTPDIEVEITEDDLAANRDPQLEKAIELLQAP